MFHVGKIFMNGRSQAVRLPFGFRFKGKEVYVRKDEKTGDVILSQKPDNWDTFFSAIDDCDEKSDFLIDRKKCDGRKTRIILMKKTDYFMIDTNIASVIIRDANQTVREVMRKIPVSSLCISTVTQAELIYGIELKPAATKLKRAVLEFLARPDILPWDEEAATHYGALRATLERKGVQMSALDTMIAAHALSKKAVLVTNDKAFARVQGLTVIDWTAA